MKMKFASAQTIREYIERDGEPPRTCKHCKKFFARYSCAKTKPGYDGECDCPKCLGYCECK